ncbi:GspH/FimT family pseudopilin [Marinicella meishanensis]|uniref:GspH/FimT family pseudopilin n=1 Tax=Marinicella meishanensis TaxID=2873263 RepID=UPI001CBF31E7|nr:GspH/FimT family pseudopilin [Marinicella sp. NBU2979]
MNAHQNHGFTLIELIIALSMLAILSAYAIPNYRTFQLNQSMTHEINRLVATINHARNQSIIAQQSVVLCATASELGCDGNSQWHAGWMAFVDHNQNRVFDGSDRLLLQEHGMADSLRAQASVYRPYIRFDRTGFAPGANQTIRFCDQRGAEYGKAVIISNVGRPRLARQITSCD